MTDRWLPGGALADTNQPGGAVQWGGGSDLKSEHQSETATSLACSTGHHLRYSTLLVNITDIAILQYFKALLRFSERQRSINIQVRHIILM